MEKPLPPASPITPVGSEPEKSPFTPPVKKNPVNSNNQNNTRNIVVFCVIMLLIVTNIFLLFRVLDNQKTVHNQEKIIVTTRVEKDALFSQLEQEKQQFQRLKKENTGLHKELEGRDAQIKEKIAQIETLLKSGNDAELKKAKDELLNLRNLNNKYIEQVATLKKENKHLTQENTELSANLQQTKNQNENLVKENTSLSAKVSVASVLKATAINVKPVRYRNSGKEVIVSRASRTEKIKVCFTLLENKIIEKGAQSLFLRIVGPDGNTWSTNHETIKFRGSQLPYSLRQEIIYDNRDMDICMFWNKGSEYMKGEYTAELYWKEQLIGSSKFALK